MAALPLACLAVVLFLCILLQCANSAVVPVPTPTPVPTTSPSAGPTKLPTFKPSPRTCKTVLYSESSASGMATNCSVCVSYSCYYCYQPTGGSFCSTSSTCAGGTMYDYSNNMCPVDVVYVPSKYDALIEEVRYYCIIVVPSVMCFCIIACRCGLVYFQERELEKMRERYQKTLEEQESQDVSDSRVGRTHAMKKLSFVGGLQLPASAQQRRSFVERDTENPMLDTDKVEGNSFAGSSRNFPTDVQRSPSPLTMLSSPVGAVYFGSLEEPTAPSELSSQPSSRMATLLNQPSMMRGRTVADRSNVGREKDDEQISL